MPKTPRAQLSFSLKLWRIQIMVTIDEGELRFLETTDVKTSYKCWVPLGTVGYRTGNTALVAVSQPGAGSIGVFRRAKPSERGVLVTQLEASIIPQLTTSDISPQEGRDERRWIGDCLDWETRRFEHGVRQTTLLVRMFKTQKRKTVGSTKPLLAGAGIDSAGTATRSTSVKGVDTKRKVETHEAVQLHLSELALDMLDLVIRKNWIPAYLMGMWKASQNIDTSHHANPVMTNVALATSSLDT
ncbi:hypothetical protein BDN67DRAFT_984090 [Paxillus ammoniavirescens]|nr:hypothetical protein BDN67DRAFT_984090 [Paxillus ammoniavirescens]